MNILEIRSEMGPVPWGVMRYEAADIFIDGRDLIEMIREIELPFAEREWDERVLAIKERGEEEEADIGPRGGIAGQYMRPSARHVYLPSENLFGRPYDHGFLAPKDKSLLLGCNCGITDCWFLRAAIEVRGDRVTWSGFEQFHRKSWSYDALGTLVFDRAAYTHAITPPKLAVAR